MLTITSGTLLNYLIKQLIERQRPFNHLMRDQGYSFPSGHSNASTLLALILLIILIPLIKFSNKDNSQYYHYYYLDRCAVLPTIFSCALYYRCSWRRYTRYHLGSIVLMILPLFYLNLRNKPNNK